MLGDLKGRRGQDLFVDRGGEGGWGGDRGLLVSRVRTYCGLCLQGYGVRVLRTGAISSTL